MDTNTNKSWFAVYVKSRTEKKTATQFQQLGIEYFLPLIKELRQWSDRKKWVEAPLFRSYIFVHIEQIDYYKVLQVNSVTRYITFEGKAVSIPFQQIVAIKYYLSEKEPETADDLNWKKGKKVEIISGSLAGLTGELVKVNGKNKISVEIEAVGKTILIETKKNKLRIL